MATLFSEAASVSAPREKGPKTNQGARKRENMNLNIWQILVLALLQGVTELFPVSSLGHTVILPGLLGWGDLVRNQQFLPLIVALHLGTSIALVAYFWRDWYQVGRTLVVSIKQGEIRRGTQQWVGWLIIIGCVPAGLLGVSLETPLKQLFATPLVAAGFLMVNGSILLLGEALRRRAHTPEVNATTERQGRQGEPAVSRTWEPVHRPVGMPNVATLERLPDPQTRPARSLASLSWKEALLVGLAQSLALIPGISRSGTTMVAGLGVGLSHEDAARYSFLLGTPLIGAAALLEVPQLFGLPVATLGLVLLGMGVAGVAAYLSTKFLLKYFERGRLHPFAYYCWWAGFVSLLFFLAVR